LNASKKNAFLSAGGLGGVIIGLLAAIFVTFCAVRMVLIRRARAHAELEESFVLELDGGVEETVL
jgi:fructose-specific phosphotransferase system IIC component